MTDPLVSLDAFAEVIGEEFDPADPNPPRMLDMASTLIRGRAHESFSADTEDVWLRGNWTGQLQLPRPPVSGVSGIEVRSGGESLYTTLASTAYAWDRLGLLLRFGGCWGGTEGVVYVVYSRGYEDVPERIQTICLTLAKRLLVYSSRFSDQQVAAADAGVSVGLTETELETVRDYDPTRRLR